MKKTMKGFPIIMALLLTSCDVTTFQVYSFELSEVQKPNIADQSYGDKIIVTDLKKDSSGRHLYEDGFLKITWEYKPGPLPCCIPGAKHWYIIRTFI